MNKISKIFFIVLILVSKMAFAESALKYLLSELPPVMCKKAIECKDPSVKSYDDCVKFFNFLGQNVDDKKIPYTKSQVKKCVEDTKKTSCADVQSNKSPKACEFMDK